MARNAFPFNGDRRLNSIGATWFVSYAYYEKVDRNHKNWAKYPNRVSTYNSNRSYHKSWLEQVILKDEARLNTNSIGLDAAQTKAMAKEILKIIE